MTTGTECESDRAGSFQKPAWLQYLDENLGIEPDSASSPVSENLDATPPSICYVLSVKTKEYLLCEDDDAAARFARQFDDLYASVYEPEFNGSYGSQKGWTGYLNKLYQDKIIQLLLELRKLPPHAVKVFVQPKFGWVDCEIWTRDPLLPWALVRLEPFGELTLDIYGDWVDQEDAAKEFDATVTYHVNFYALQARCTGAGLDEGYKYRFTIAGQIISRGPATAAQYIILAGDVIDAECVKKQLPPHLHRDWKGWANDALESGGELDFRLFEKNRAALKDM
ncbi:hypothetical protein C8A03DRAFT_35309, partial [Achaetomium macrosporum]